MMDRRNVSDEGFSLIEVMFAAFIAFFVLTAVFGMLVVSTRQGRTANQDEVATNLATLVVEEARALPYASLGTSGTVSPEVPGVLASTETTTFGPYQFTITRSVTWVDDPTNDSETGDVTHDYKRLTVGVGWTGGHITPVVTFVREHTVESPDIPIVQFVHAPLNGKVLFKDTTNPALARVWAGDPAAADAYLADASGGGISTASYDASASVVETGGVIGRVEYYVDNTLVSGLSGFPSLWTGGQTSVLWPSTTNVPPWTGAPFALNLNAVNGTTPLFGEGMHTIRCVAYTSAMAIGTDLRIFTVDNRAPVFDSTAASLTPVPDNSDRYWGVMTLGFQPALDGADICRRYDIRVQQSGAATSGPWVWQDLGLTGSTTFFAGMPSGLSPSPFTAYKVALTPRSVRGLTGDTIADTGWRVTAPRLTGSIYNRASNKKAPPDIRFDLNITSPSASTLSAMGAASVVYDIYEQAGPEYDSHGNVTGGYTYPGSGDLPSTALRVQNDLAGSPFQVLTGTAFSKYYQVVARLKNSAGVEIGSIRSNVVGVPTSAPTFQTSAALAIP